jgi:hypothetical protein
MDDSQHNYTKPDNHHSLLGKHILQMNETAYNYLQCSITIQCSPLELGESTSTSGFGLREFTNKDQFMCQRKLYTTAIDFLACCLTSREPT